MLKNRETAKHRTKEHIILKHRNTKPKKLEKKHRHTKTKRFRNKETHKYTNIDTRK